MGMKHRVEHGLARFFTALGRFIGKYPWAVLSVTLATTAFFSLGLIWFEETNNVRTEYSPIDSPSRKEYEVTKEFLNHNGTLDPSYIMIEAKDGGSLLRKDYRDKIVAYTKYLHDNVTINHKGEIWDFRRLCEPYCELNTAFLAFLKLYDDSDPSSGTYPAIEIFGTKAFIGNNVYGVKLTNESIIESFSTAILPIYLVAPYKDTSAIYEWLIAAKDAFEEPQFALFRMGVTGDALVSAEVRRMGMETAPLIAGSVVAMIVFVVMSSFRSDPSRAKPWEAVAGCIVPLLALLSAMGILNFFDLKFQSIIVASFFLVLSVGVDDVFIILRAWDRTNGPVVERMGSTLEEAGPSITISALTNAAAFFVGMSSSTPAVQSFSLFSAVAIIICFVYELVFFSAILALSGRRESGGMQSLLCCFQADPQAHCRLVEALVRVQHTVISWWSKAVAWWSIRVVMVVSLLFYYYVSALGIMDIHTFITIEKMALPDSYLQHFQERYETALRNMQPISVFITKPGDLTDPENLAVIKSIVADFENALHSYGPNSTYLWLNAYEDFLSFYNEDSSFTYEEIPTFFKSSSYFYLSSFVKYNESACAQNIPECIPSFFFLTNFHDVIKYHELIPVVNDWRRIADKYKSHGVYAFSDHSPFVDQTMAIDSTVWSSVATALGCTALACFIFLPDLKCIICAVMSVFSITVGVIGLLSLWGLDLDPLSMAALLMAIGFSVDFTAHICYHFYKARHPKVSDRIEECLTSIGMPLVQVGLSTIVALAPLLFKQSYLAVVFLKTITVVVLLGMIHGLIVLPIVLTFVAGDSSSPFSKSSTPSTASTDSERSSQKSVERKESFYRTQALIARVRQEFEHAKVAPVSPEEAAGKSPAFKHKIALGRTPSTQ
ncbi:hypothetical protein PRIPAC_90179 [Pristionchus pacificus]|uniref:Hedgehog receptor n=1 Tax=Pristionchus pacificus TaxID=54126 RepID=A0A2A6CTJ4_PRIPA|nr:hypothetical protein PRIPAC_90179 [Pristionchus pacificus]|eukprot:PDM81505.1 Hedgehog receptor [Pristionchus pacificus]